ncbi:MAG TPA: helix-turn-helix domain-containing protein [Ktedonobacteraceae bacterium]|jgi:AraC-like DNA-binding protein
MRHAHDETIDTIIIGFSNRRGRADPMPHAHRHNEIELNFLEQGSLTYLLGGTRVEVKSEQLAVFWATIPHRTIDVAQNTIFSWLTIPFPLFLEWRLPDRLVQQMIRGACILDPRGQQRHLREMFLRWHEDLQSGEEERRKIVLLEVEACLRRLALSLPSEQTSNQPALGQAQSKVERMAEFIAAHYTESVHIEDIAEAVHLHPNYAMNLFRKRYGISIAAYITQHRMAHAQRLLITSDATISAIALEAGFGSVSRFYSVFKATYGYQPGEYRSHLRTWLR